MRPIRAEMLWTAHFTLSFVATSSSALLGNRDARDGHLRAGEWRKQFPVSVDVSVPVEATTKARAREFSDIEINIRPPLNSGLVSLLDNRRAIAQIASLECRTNRAGKDSIDHPPGGRDDIANVIAGAVHLVLARPKQYETASRAWLVDRQRRQSRDQLE